MVAKSKLNATNSSEISYLQQESGGSGRLSQDVNEKKSVHLKLTQSSATGKRGNSNQSLQTPSTIDRKV